MLSGTLPEDALNEFRRLSVLDVQENNITGTVPSITKPQMFMLYYGAFNNFTGSLPTLHQSLNTFYFDRNNLTGDDPVFCSILSITCLIILSVYFRPGSLPDSLGYHNNLVAINLNHNYLHGTIPPGLTRGSMLQLVSLAHNLLSGEVPSSISPSLNNLILNSNQLNGTLPADLCGLPCNLNDLQVSDNKLCGKFPEEVFENLVSLSTLDVGRNRLTGTIPESMYHLTRLRVVTLSDNMFSGPLSRLLNFPRLNVLEVEENRFTGPLILPLMSNIRYVNVSDNLLAGRLVINDSVGKDTLTTLDVSRNLLTGSIPTRLNMVCMSPHSSIT